MFELKDISVEPVEYLATVRELQECGFDGTRDQYFNCETGETIYLYPDHCVVGRYEKGDNA